MTRALLLCLLLTDCADIAGFSTFAGYLNGGLTNGGGAARAAGFTVPRDHQLSTDLS